MASRERREGKGESQPFLRGNAAAALRCSVRISQLWLAFLRVLRGERRVSPMSPNKVHSDPSNSLHCPLAATAASHQCSLLEATRGWMGDVSTDIEVPLSEIIALQSTVERDSVLSKGGRAGVGQDWLRDFQSPAESSHSA